MMTPKQNTKLGLIAAFKKQIPSLMTYRLSKINFLMAMTTANKRNGASLEHGMQSAKIALLALAVGTVLLGSANAALVIFQDDFDASHDYTGGVGATGWDGLLQPSTTVFNSNTSNAGNLTMASTGTWSGTTDMDTPFLYLNVTGDFVATTVIDSSSTVGNFHTIGLAAVDPGNTDSFVTAQASYTGNERHFAWSTVDGARTQNQVSTSLANLNYYQIERLGDVFTSRYSDNSGSTWIDINSYTRADLADTLQVGVWHSAVSVSSRTAQFQSFTLAVPEPSSTALLGLGLSSLLLRRRRS